MFLRPEGSLSRCLWHPPQYVYLQDACLAIENEVLASPSVRPMLGSRWPLRHACVRLTQCLLRRAATPPRLSWKRRR